MSLPQAFLDAKESDSISYIEIYDIALRTGMIHIAATNKEIMFDGKSYVSIPIERGTINKSVDTLDNDMDLTISDVDNDKLAYLMAGFDFRGCMVLVRQILYPESLDDPSLVRDTFYGELDSPCYEDGKFTFSIKSRIPKIKTPRRSCQVNCNSEFGDSLCTMSKDQRSGTINPVENDQIQIGITAINDYWKDGIITINGESRMIKTSTDQTVYLYYPFFQTLAAGLNFQIERGCDKTSTTCDQRFNNDTHYSGFKAIPFESVYR